MHAACLILDDAVFADRVRLLEEHGITAVRFANEWSLFRAPRRQSIDVVLVDVGADADFESRVFACLQRWEVEPVPVVLQTIDRLAHRNALAFEAGVTDVVSRGTEGIELAARLAAAARRGGSGGSAAVKLSCAGFDLDHANRSITDRNVPIDLTPREFALAWLLFSNQGRCVSRRIISLAVWGVQTDVSSRTMEQHVHQLRRKLGLGLGPEHGIAITAVYGAGYRLAVRAQPASTTPKTYAAPRPRPAAGGADVGAHSRNAVRAAPVVRIDWMLAGHAAAFR